MHTQNSEKINAPSKKSSVEKVESAAKMVKVIDADADNLEDVLYPADSEEETSNVTTGFIDLATYDELEKDSIKSTDETL